MDLQIAVMLVQDGIINGAIYALMALALVLVFSVTRVIFIPQGEFVAYAALAMAALQAGQSPPLLWMLLGLAALVLIVELVRQTRGAEVDWRSTLFWAVLLPLLAAAAVLGGCASAGIGIGVPILPGVSLGVGVGSGGNVQVGVGAGAGPVGVGVGVNQHGQVSAGAGVGASAPVGGGARVGVGVGTGTVIHDPRRSAPAAAPAAPRPAAGEQS